MLSAHHSEFGCRASKSKFSNVGPNNTLMPLKLKKMTNMPQFRGLLLFILMRSYTWESKHFYTEESLSKTDLATQELLKHKLMVVMALVSVGASHREVFVLCCVYHRENMPRSTTMDRQWCQEDI